MSVTTKTGDRGWTKLLFGRSARKDSPRVEAYGTVDELVSVMGLAKSHLRRKSAKDAIHALQHDLFILASEIAVLPRDRKRLEYRIDADSVRSLEKRIAELEDKLKLEECCFLIPGEDKASAFLDVARTVARRAERLVAGLARRRKSANPHVAAYLNRLSDLLYLMARAEEKRHRRFRASARPETGKRRRR
jgi:cob(I)alamin adenosyltransferase